MAIFPILPSEYGENSMLVYLGAVFFSILVNFSVLPRLFANLKEKPSSSSLMLLQTQMFLVMISAVLVGITMERYLAAREKLPSWLTFSNWFLAFGSIPLARYSPPQSLLRLL